MKAPSPANGPPAAVPGSAAALCGPMQPEWIAGGLLHEVLAATAARAPKQVALRCGTEALTYLALRQRGTKFARYLRRLGVKAGDAVVLWMPRGLDMYAAFLGILEAGAYYVPMDPDFPPDRVAYVAQDCQARALVTTSALVAGVFACPVVLFDQEQRRIEVELSEPLRAVQLGLTPEHPAYAIYTSGTTGRPKGVLISHRSIRHFIHAEGAVAAITEKDIVVQGESLSFDLSLEEIWLSFAVGATLLTLTKEQLHTGGDLGKLLARAGVTVWSCVPTLLALQTADIPSLRLLIVGGEVCPPDLVRRWARPGRRMLNTYGPTETTITATWCELHPGRPVTIGQPLPNYTAYVLDELRQPVPRGESGELCLGGPGVALGYLNRPKLTAEKFIPNPWAGADARDPRLYRSGDLVRINAEGNIEFLGRIDTQVKIRGYRIELGEIEAVLVECGGLRNAVVAVQTKDGGDGTLVAYLLPRDGEVVDEAALRAQCRERLPAYMVPAIFASVTHLPTLPSGKVDRRNLPPITSATVQAASTRRVAAPSNSTEQALHQVWSELFAPADVSLDDDFFLDLGGHSLRAAALVSQLRKEPRFRHISMRDVYAHPTLRRLAAQVGGGVPRAGTPGESTPEEEFLHVPDWRYLACGLAQAASLVLVFVFYSLQLLVPYLVYAWWVILRQNRWQAVGFSMMSFLLILPVMLFIAVAGKWLVLGRAQPGDYPLWGLYYFRWWFVQRLLGVVPTDDLAGTPLLGLYYRLLGARIGAGVHLDSDAIDAPDLVEIGEGASLGTGAVLVCAKVENGRLKLRRISIGRYCCVANGAVVSGGAVMRDRAHLNELSLLSAGGVIPAAEVWGGSPSAKVGVAGPPPPLAPINTRFAHGMAFFGMFFVFPILATLPIFPGMILLTELGQRANHYVWLVLTPFLAVCFIVAMCLEIAALKWILLGRVKPGLWPVYSDYYLRLWFVDKLMDLSLEIVNSLYSTLYLNPWYRLLGAKVGRRAEISTASSVSHDLLELGDESFIADAVMLGAPRVHDGVIELRATQVGRRAFVGNSALVPAGTVLGEDVLIGCLSVPPRAAAEAAQPGTSWFGSPAIFLPRRQQAQGFHEGATFKPPPDLVAQRLFIEFFRVILPPTLFIAMNSLLISLVLTSARRVGLAGLLWRFPLLDIALTLVVCGFVLALKWVIIGRYRPTEKPLWCDYVWRSELVTSTYENVVVPLLGEHLLGTPFLSPLLRLFGVRVGRRVFFDSADITEFDVVTIGDDAALNQDCGLQTHLFEDRVMKISTVVIGARCVLGSSSIVLYDSVMEDDSLLDDLSMLMKGETLPAGTAWQGSPARPLSFAKSARPARPAAARPVDGGAPSPEGELTPDPASV